MNRNLKGILRKEIGGLEKFSQGFTLRARISAHTGASGGSALGKEWDGAVEGR
ncbi:MAG: hypothetical protein JWP91_1123 [Fibrobacteres bacterium]|nr:hypothetical protein [Fibrobacterota bacterium]